MENGSFQPYPNLEVLNLRERDGTLNLLSLMTGIPRPKIRMQNVAMFPLPAGLIASMVLPHNHQTIGAKTAIVESEYVDRDTNVAYAQLFARAFRDYPRRTSRVHFFSEEFGTCEELVSEKSLQDSYLGFCVLSASQPVIIGRTVLPSPRNAETSYFTTTKSDFSVNLCGIQLGPSGTAFVQQDGRVAACASAAIWMSTVILARRFGYDMPVRSMAEITKLATRYSPLQKGLPFLPALTVEQMLWALQEMGYDAGSHDAEKEDVVELLYSTVESGIPPIMVIYLPRQESYHAIIAVGHEYNFNFRPDKELKDSWCSASSWSPCFLVHDDQIGPYLKIAIGPPIRQGNRDYPSLEVEILDSYTSDFGKNILDWYQDATLRYIIVPFPPRHILTQHEAYIKGRTILELAYDIHGSRHGISMPENPVFRTYLVPSNEFKNHYGVFGKGETSSSDEISHCYRGSVYPRYVWVMELCGVEHRENRKPDELRIIADVTIDPTSSPRSQDFVTLHIPKMFFRMLPSDDDVNRALFLPIAFFKDDGPYRPLIRLETSQDE